jgi:alkaline phosphatase D
MKRRTNLLLTTLLLFVLSFTATAQTNKAATKQKAKTGATELLKSGPMVGYSEMTETVVWLQTKKPCRTQIRYWKRGTPETAKKTEVVETNEKSDLIARFTISNLEFGTRYDYEVYLNNQPLKFQYETSFQTQAMWRFRTDPPNFRIAIGSCAYINDTPFDRPGNPYGSGYEVFKTLAAQKPDAMLWLGDNTYYREADWLTETGMRYRYAHTRAMPEMQQLLASTHNYAIWDDHDYGPNDSDRSFRGRETSLKVFKDYWANQAYGTMETSGVFFRFEWGDVEFFMLDDRFHRSPNFWPTGPDKVMFGEAQMRWLMESLVNSRAPFKVIAGGNQLMNPMTLFEGFGRFPEEQRRLINFIRDAKIEGVLFLSGDRHHTELIKRTEQGLYPLYEFTSSPLTSGTGRIAAEENNAARVPGTWVTGVKNFGLIELSSIKDANGKIADRVMTLRAIDLTGKEWWKHEIKASELKFPKTQ